MSKKRYFCQKNRKRTKSKTKIKTELGEFLYSWVRSEPMRIVVKDEFSKNAKPLFFFYRDFLFP